MVIHNHEYKFYFCKQMDKNNKFTIFRRKNDIVKHRLNGPATERFDGCKEFYINGKKITNEI